MSDSKDRKAADLNTSTNPKNPAVRVFPASQSGNRKKRLGHGKDIKEPDMTEKTEQFIFLPDDPTIKDAFGTHERIAENIAKKVESKTAGKTIGLEGTWGSGKSSIVKMLEEGWNNSKDIHLFTFDAWGHQGDSLRRAFLEEFIDSFEKTDREHWLLKCKRFNADKKCCECDSKEGCPERISNELKQRSEDNTIVTTPSISIFGVLFATVLLVLLPIGWACISATGSFGDRMFSLGAHVIIISLGILILCSLYGLLKGENILALMFGKTREETKHTTQRTVDPTSVDFRAYYSELLRCILAEKKHKLVLVIDNLDRVETQTALNMWASMQTFIKPGRSNSNYAAKRVWVIVPYDKDAISDLWEKDRPESVLPGNSKVDLGGSFRDKTFQIRYTVPPPLTTKWKEYFSKNLSKAIRDVSDDILDKIFHIFRNEGEFKFGVPTPREMKLYINRIVAIALQHYPNDASLEEIALYASYEMSKPEIFANLANEDANKNLRVKYFVGANFKEGLAAIHYGVPRIEANEVLYKPEIAKALKNGRPDELKKLLKDPAAQVICDNYIKETAFYWPSLKELLKASAAFAGYASEECSSGIRHSIKSLADHLKDIDGEYFKFNKDLQEDNVDDLIRLIDFCPEIIPGVREKLSILMVANDYESVKDLDTSVLDWVKATLKVMKSIKEHEKSPTIYLKLSGVNYYNLLLNFVADEDSNFLKHFCVPDHLCNKYLNGYLKRIETGDIEKKDKEVIAGLLKMNNLKDEHHKLITKALVNEFIARPIDILCLVYEILFKHKEIAIFAETLVSLAEDGRAFTTLHQHSADKSLASYCLTNILLFNPDPQFEKGHAAAGGVATFQSLMDKMSEDIAKATSRKIIEINVFEEMCNSISSEIKKCKGFGQILQVIVADDSMISCLTPERFIEMHDSLKLHLNENMSEDGISYYEGLVEHLLSDSFVKLLADQSISRDYAHAYHIAIGPYDVNSKPLIDKLTNGLNDSIKENEWYEELCKEPEHGILCVTVELVKKGCKLKLTRNFVDALIRHAKDLIEGSVTIGTLKDSWGCLLDALARTERIRFREKLLEMINDANKPLLQILPIYENEIKQAFDTANKGLKDAFLHNVCVRIAENTDECERTWMLGLLDEKELLIKAKETEKSLLQERLKDYLVEMYNQETPEGESDSEQISKEVIGRIAKQLEIELDPETSESNGKSEDVGPEIDSK